MRAAAQGYAGRRPARGFARDRGVGFGSRVPLMRVLILFESLIVLALAGLILFGKPVAAVEPAGDAFPAARMLLDAVPGESVRYRVDDGRSTLAYTVGTVDRGGPSSPPRLQISRAMTDIAGRPIHDDAPSYTHLPYRHFLFPLIAQEAPGAFDRVWILKRIQRVTFPWKGQTLRCWRVDCTDPALPKDRDAVVLWMHEACPVFGIFRWERAGHTYEADWNPPK